LKDLELFDSSVNKLNFEINELKKKKFTKTNQQELKYLEDQKLFLKNQQEFYHKHPADIDYFDKPVEYDIYRNLDSETMSKILQIENNLTSNDIFISETNFSSEDNMIFFYIFRFLIFVKFIEKSKISSSDIPTINKIKKFHNDLLLQRWHLFGNYYKKIISYKKDDYPKLLVDVFLTGTIHQFPEICVERLVYEELLLNFRSLPPKKFLSYCNEMKEVCKYVENVTKDENVFEKYVDYSTRPMMHYE